MADEPILVPISDWESSTKCPKCESSGDDLSSVWNKTGEGKVNGVEYEFEDPKKGTPYEHLEMSCKKCGYQWLMETADAETRKEAMETDLKAENSDKEDLKALVDDEPEGPAFIPHPSSSSSGHLRRLKGSRSDFHSTPPH